MESVLCPMEPVDPRMASLFKTASSFQLSAISFQLLVFAGIYD
jgi:hypothetical protein